MLWIKRNMFLAVTGFIAALLLGGGIYFVWAGKSRNAALDKEVEDTRGELNTIYIKDPFPHSTNVDLAKKEVAKMQDAVGRMVKYFTPVPVEAAALAVRGFTEMRDRTLSELRDLAQKAGVALPGPGVYAFTFEAQRGKVGNFGLGTFPDVPEQMAEVRALCGTLYDARVTRILNIRRARASADDFNSNNAQDYTDRDLKIETNTIFRAKSHPYEVTFHCFSSEIGQILTALGKSPHGFVVKAVQVEPEDMKMADSGGPVMAAAQPPPPNPNQPQPPAFTRNPGRFPPGVTPPPGVRPPPPQPGVQRPPVGAGDRPVVLLKEKRLRTTLLVYVIKPAK